MASGSNGISGVAVAVATVGGILVYAGFRGVNPLEALRDVASGKPPAVESSNAGLDDSGGGTQERFIARRGSGAALAQAAHEFQNDRYSQARRHSAGYSDCSSFVSKAMKRAGMTPPTIDTTAGFYTTKLFKTIPLSQADAGDIVISATVATVGAHMIIVTGPGKGIGQQNAKSNVQEGTIKDLMSRTRYKYVARRYVGPGSNPDKKEDDEKAASA